VPTGSDSLTVTKAGYVAAVVAVPARGSSSDARIGLTHSAAISGHVADRYGRATENTFVTAVPVTRDEPSSSSVRQFYAQTDGLGDYRLSGLPPGRFRVRALRTREGRVPPNLSREELLFGAGSYVDAGATLDLTVNSGDEITGADFTSPGTPPACGSTESLRPAPGVVRAIIRGRVTGALGEPVPCAHVTVMSPVASVPPGETDEQGFYTIYALPAGTFSLNATASAYVLPLNPAVTITLRAGEEREHVDFVLARTGVITGRVVDEHGEPLEGIRIAVFNGRRYAGRYLVPSSSPGGPTTDDRGQYRITGLQPGRYFVSASASGDASGGGGFQGVGYAPIYYPNSPDLSAAVRVAVDAGQSLTGIDIGFAPTPTFTVAGQVVERQGAVPAQVTLALRARTGMLSVINRSVDVPGDGTFAFRNVAPGDYVLKAQERPLSSNGPFAVAYVRVTDADPQPVTLMMVERSTIEGRVVLETVTSNLESLELSLSAASDDPDMVPPQIGPGLVRDRYALGVGKPNTSPFAGIAGPVDNSTISRLNDAHFRISDVTGRNRLYLTSNRCRTCFIKSATVNGVDATDQPFDVGLIGQPVTGVEVVVSDKGGVVEGRVLDEHEAPLEGFVVIVFSSFRDRWYDSSPYVQSARAARDGSFTVMGLPPGDYLAAVVSPGERAQSDADVTDAAVLDPLMSAARRLTIREGDRQSITLHRSRP
jgi:hypothetical protein